jgi:TolA-binding protein
MWRRLSVIVAASCLVLTFSRVPTATALEEGDRYWLVGRGAYEDKLYPLALHALKRFTDLYPNHREAPQGLLLLGKTYLTVNKLDEALLAFQRAQRVQPPPGRSQEVRFLEAETLVQLKRYSDAQNAYRTVLQTDPTSPFTAESLYGLGWTALELKQSEEAVGNFRAMLARAPDHTLAPSATFYLARILVELKRYSEAIPLLDSFLAKSPGHEQASNARYLRGISRIESGQVAQGVADLREFVAAEPTGPLAMAARRRVTETVMKHAQPADLATEYRTLMAMQPSSADLLYDASQIAAKLGNPRDQVAAWTRLRKEFPKDPLTLRASVELASAAFKRAEYRDALAYAELATRSDDDTLRAEALLLKAESELKLKQTAAALRDFKEASGILGVDPSLRIRAVAGTAIGQEEAGQWGEALKLYDEVATDARDETLAAWARGAVVSLGKRRLEAGDLPVALEAARRAQRYDASPAPKLLEAQALSRSKQYAAAIVAYDAVLAVDGQSPAAAEATLGRADAEVELKRPDAAVATLRQFTDRWPDNPLAATAAFRTAKLLVEQKRLDEAVPALDAFLQSYPTSELATEAQYLRGMALVDSGKTQEGVAALRSAIAAAPSHPLAPAARKKMVESLAGSGRTSGDRGALTEVYQALMAESPSTPQGLYDAGLIAGQLKKPADQDAAWRKLRKEFPADPLTHRASLQQAHEAFARNDFKDSVALATAASVSTDDTVRGDAFLLLGEAELKLRHFPQAVKAFNSSLETPGMAPALRYRALAGSGIAYEETKQLGDALALYEEVAKNATDDGLRTWATERAKAVRERMRAAEKPAPKPAAPEKKPPEKKAPEKSSPPAKKK